MPFFERLPDGDDFLFMVPPLHDRGVVVSHEPMKAVLDCVEIDHEFCQSIVALGFVRAVNFLPDREDLGCANNFRIFHPQSYFFLRGCDDFFAFHEGKVVEDEIQGLGRVQFLGFALFWHNCLLSFCREVYAGPNKRQDNLFLCAVFLK